MNENTIGVIIPFFSHKEWLIDAIESVLNQTRKADEIIVINDGSNCDINDIRKKYENEVRFEYQNNRGAASARNRGISICKCDYLAFLDSDDLWDNTKLEKQMNFMINGNYNWTATPYKCFGNCKEKTVYPYVSEKLCWEHIYNSCKIQTSTIIIKRNALGNYRFAEDMRNGQDVYLWFKLSNNYPLGVLLEPLTKFRIRGTNAHLNYRTHIRVRALLWEKMNISHQLQMPKHILTKIGYKICHKIFLKDNNVANNFYNKFLFIFSWCLFRIDNLILRKGN